MIDLFDKGNKFSLKVKGYEFPGAQDDRRKDDPCR